MEDGQYATISDYLEHETYPAVFIKSQIFVLQRSCKNYKLVKGKLYYKEQIQDGTDWNQHFVKRSESFLECHLTVGGHSRRGVTVEKVKER